jgi:hypothetical protein
VASARLKLPQALAHFLHASRNCRRGVSPAPAVLPGRRWARTAAACRGCGETTRRHHAHGLCRRCYARQRAHTPATPEGVEESRAYEVRILWDVLSAKTDAHDDAPG